MTCIVLNKKPGLYVASAELPSVELIQESCALTYRMQTLRGNSFLRISSSSPGKVTFDSRRKALLRDHSRSGKSPYFLRSEPIIEKSY